jgi:hypothetical protein
MNLEHLQELWKTHLANLMFWQVSFANGKWKFRASPRVWHMGLAKLKK